MFYQCDRTWSSINPWINIKQKLHNQYNIINKAESCAWIRNTLIGYLFRNVSIRNSIIEVNMIKYICAINACTATLFYQQGIYMPRTKLYWQVLFSLKHSHQQTLVGNLLFKISGIISIWSWAKISSFQSIWKINT